jgi:hypothetical protein
VHALNVLRLILSDASLGPDLNTYVAETAQLAVSGFTAPQWAVRNSCMMVFTAVAQRAVGTDKNDSAGAAVPTIAEFFQRFPALEPFLLTALTVATDSQDGVHPTLYPLLLLIAKLRVAVLKETDADVAEHSKRSSVEGLVRLVDRCCSQKVQAVRVIAAKALRVLTPVSGSIGAACERLSQATLFAEDRDRTHRLKRLHGRLVAARELVRSVSSFVEANEYTNAEQVASLRSQTSAELLPALSQAVYVLLDVPCAALHVPLLETVRFVRAIVVSEGDDVRVSADQLLVMVCRQQLPAVYAASTLPAGTYTPPPFEPWLWRECVDSLVQMSLLGSTPPILQAHMLSLDTVGELLQHPVSEVREGALRGLLAHLNASSTAVFADTLLESLLQRVAAETEPPVAQLAMQLFTRYCLLAILQLIRARTNSILQHAQFDRPCSAQLVLVRCALPLPPPRQQGLRAADLRPAWFRVGWGCSSAQAEFVCTGRSGGTPTDLSSVLHYTELSAYSLLLRRYLAGSLGTTHLNPPPTAATAPSRAGWTSWSAPAPTTSPSPSASAQPAPCTTQACCCALPAQRGPRCCCGRVWWRSRCCRTTTTRCAR